MQVQEHCEFTSKRKCMVSGQYTGVARVVTLAFISYLVKLTISSPFKIARLYYL